MPQALPHDISTTINWLSISLSSAGCRLYCIARLPARVCHSGWSPTAAVLRCCRRCRRCKPPGRARRAMPRSGTAAAAASQRRRRRRRALRPRRPARRPKSSRSGMRRRCLSGCRPATTTLPAHSRPPAATQFALGWLLGSYRLNRYRGSAAEAAARQCADRTARARTCATRRPRPRPWDSARDLINAPANELGPEELAAAAGAPGCAHRRRQRGARRGVAGARLSADRRRRAPAARVRRG